MATISKVNYDDKLDITLTKICKVSPDKAGKIAGVTKTVNVEVSYKGLTFKDVMAKALKSDIISYQNGVARKNYEKLVNGETVKIDAASPGANYIDPEEKVLASFDNKSEAEQLAFIKQLETMVKNKGKK
jgi:hypothetical protein